MMVLLDPAPCRVTPLVMAILLFQVHEPAGTITVPPVAAESIADCTSTREQLVAFTVPPLESVKVAVTVVLEERERTQVPVPEQGLPQPVKVETEEAEAVRVTEVPPERAVEVQVEPQVIPPTDEVTVPEPVPDFVMLTV